MSTSRGARSSTSAKNNEQVQIEQIYAKHAFTPDKKGKEAFEELRRLSKGTLESLEEGFQQGGVSILHELIQNADDASDDENSRVEIEINIIDKYLIFSHSGKHFDEEDVQKICRIRDHETKGKQGKSGKTGYKGLGFKSVFIVSKKVIIFSENYQFRFDQSYVEQHKEKNLPWILMPIWTEKATMSAEILTEIDKKNWVHLILEFSETGKEIILKEILKLSDETQNLLFLKKIEKISFPKVIKAVAHKLSGQVGTIEIDKDDKTHRININVNNKIRHWVKKEYSVDIDPEIKKDLQEFKHCPPRLKDKKETETTLSFALEINEEGRIIKSHGLVYVTLPLANIHVDFPYYINADFLPDLFRTQLIERNTEWNHYLWKNIGYKVFKLLADLAADLSQRRYFLDMLPKREALKSLKNFDKSFLTGFDLALQEVAFIPAEHENNLLLKVDEALIDRNDFFATFGIDYRGKKKLVAKNIDNIDRLHEELRVEKLDSNELLAYAKKYLQANKDPAKHRNLLLFLKDLIDNKILSKEQIKNSEIVLCANEDILRPSEKIFIDNSVPPELANSLSLIFINKNILDEEGKLSAWLIELDLQSLTPENLIRKGLEFIKKVKTSPTTEEKDSIVIFTRYIFKMYGKGRLSNELKYLLIRELTVLTKNAMLPPAHCYLANKYQPELTLQDLDELHNYPNFISEAYIENDKDIPQWKEFFKKLGVVDNICVDRKKNYNRGLAEYQRPYLKEYFKAHGTMRGEPSEHTISEFLDVPLCHLLVDPNFRLVYSTYFWRALANDIQAIKQHFNHALKYLGKNNTAIKVESPPPFLIYFLQNNNVVSDQKGIFHKINELYAPHLKDAVGDIELVAQIPVELKLNDAKLFGFKVELTIKDCLNLLTKLAAQPNPNFEQFRAIFKIILDLPLSGEIQNECESWAKNRGSRLPAQSNEMQDVTKLHIIDIIDSSFEYPTDSSNLLKQLEGFSQAEMLQLATLFKIKRITPTISFDAQEVDTETKMILWNKLLPVIASIKAQKSHTNHKICLEKFCLKFKELQIIKCLELSQKLVDDEVPLEDSAYLQLNSPHPILYYKFEAGVGLPLDRIAEILIDFFELSIKPNTLEGLLKIIFSNTAENNFEEWLKQKRYKTEKYKELVILHKENQLSEAYKDSAPVVSVEKVGKDNQVPTPVLPKTANILPPISIQLDVALVPVVSSEPTNDADDYEINLGALDLDKKIKITESPKNTGNDDSKQDVAESQKKPSIFSKEKIKFSLFDPNRPDVFFKPVAGSGVNNPKNANTNIQNDDDSETSDPKKKYNGKNQKNEMSEDEKTRIGAWGEIAVFMSLKNAYQKKINDKKSRFADCILNETEKGFIITKTMGNIVKKNVKMLECVWNNKKGMEDNLDYEESKKHYDFKLIKYCNKDGKESQRERSIIIEVKSTKENGPSLAYLTIKEIQELRKAGNDYRLYRLYNAGNYNNYRIKKLKSCDLPIIDDQPNAALFKVEIKM